jgi:hypothetical protein
VAALVARHDIEGLGEQVHNFPFALVSPLGSQDDDVFHFARNFYVSKPPQLSSARLSRRRLALGFRFSDPKQICTTKNRAGIVLKG